MSLQDFLAVAGTQILRQDPKNPEAYLQSAEPMGTPTAVFQFCDGRLYRLSFDAGQFFQFVSEAEKLSTKYGPAVSTAKAVGGSAELGLEWQSGEGEITSLMLVTNYGASVPEAKVSYNAQAKVCAEGLPAL